MNRALDPAARPGTGSGGVGNIAHLPARGRFRVRGVSHVLVGPIADRVLLLDAATGAPLLLADELRTGAALAEGLRRGDVVATPARHPRAAPAQPKENRP